MATIQSLGRSISMMDEGEAQALVKKLRLSRRTPKAGSKVARKASGGKATPKPVSGKKLAKTLTPEQKAELIALLEEELS